MKKNLLYTLLYCPLLTAGEPVKKASLLAEQSLSLESFIDSLRSAGIYAHYQTMKQAIESLLSQRMQSSMRQTVTSFEELLEP